MFRLGKKTEYSILALRYLGRNESMTATVREIAEACRVPAPLLAKLLQQLARSGLVYSLQGVNGGYRLRGAIAAITLAEVIEAIEGPFKVTACGGVEGRCSRSGFCDLRSAMAPVQDQMLNYLQTVTLADLQGPRGKED